MHPCGTMGDFGEQLPVKVLRSSSELCSLRHRRVEHTTLPAKQEQTLQSIVKDAPWPERGRGREREKGKE